MRPQDVFNETRSILEPAGAVAVAGAKAYLKHYNLKVSLAVLWVDSGLDKAMLPLPSTPGPTSAVSWGRFRM
mgnify:CR=1 FL=1